MGLRSLKVYFIHFFLHKSLKKCQLSVLKFINSYIKEFHDGATKKRFAFLACAVGLIIDLNIIESSVKVQASLLVVNITRPQISVSRLSKPSDKKI